MKKKCELLDKITSPFTCTDVYSILDLNKKELKQTQK